MSKDTKKKKKSKLVATVLYTSEEGMRGGLNDLIATQLEITRAKSRHQLAITSLNEAHEEALAPKLERVAILESSIALFCINHRATWLPAEGPKSKKFENAEVGFRFNPHSVSLTLPDDTEALVALRIESTVDQREEERAAAVMASEPMPAPLDWLMEFVVMKPTIDKKRLLAKREQLTLEQHNQLKALGITFTQVEQFFIEPDPELVARSTQPADPAQEAAAA